MRLFDSLLNDLGHIFSLPHYLLLQWLLQAIVLNSFVIIQKFLKHSERKCYTSEMELQGSVLKPAEDENQQCVLYT